MIKGLILSLAYIIEHKLFAYIHDCKVICLSHTYISLGND